MFIYYYSFHRQQLCFKYHHKFRRIEWNKIFCTFHLLLLLLANNNTILDINRTNRLNVRHGKLFEIMLISNTHRVSIHAIWNFPVTKKWALAGSGFAWWTHDQKVCKEICEMNWWENNVMLRFYSLWIHDDVFGKRIEKMFRFQRRKAYTNHNYFFPSLTQKKCHPFWLSSAMKQESTFQMEFFSQSNRQKCAIHLCETILKIM